jgi:hypothetical protein
MARALSAVMAMPEICGGSPDLAVRHGIRPVKLELVWNNKIAAVAAIIRGARPLARHSRYLWRAFHSLAYRRRTPGRRYSRTTWKS